MSGREKRRTRLAVLPFADASATTADEPGGVYAIVKRGGTWIHFQIRRGDLPERKRQSFEIEYLPKR